MGLGLYDEIRLTLQYLNMIHRGVSQTIPSCHYQEIAFVCSLLCRACSWRMKG